jgi:hypothetical protein
VFQGKVSTFHDDVLWLRFRDESQKIPVLVVVHAVEIFGM